MFKAFTDLELHWQILIALVLAVFAGVLSGQDATIFGVSFFQIYTFIGTLFLNALKMLIVPLIVSSIIVGIMGIGSGENFSRLGSKTLIYYASTSFLAIMTGLIIVNLTMPGIIDGQPLKDVIGLASIPDAVSAKVEGKGAGDIVDVFLRMVPPNIVAAAAEGQMLGLIFFSLLFGYFMTKLKGEQEKIMQGFWQAVLDVMMHMTNWVMKFAPLGVFALVAKVVAVSGVEIFIPLAVFFFTVIGALALHFIITMSLILRFVGKVKNPLLHYKAMSAALLTAFSTSSSSATLPLTMECVEKNAGVSNKVSSFTLPLGATVNMDGTALYECVAAIFIAQAYGLELTLTTQFTIVLVALVTSIGVAGIPSASLVAISIILATIGLPLEGVGLILAVDRVLDMCRTAVNVFSDSVAAVVIAKLEGEKDILES